MPASGDQMNRSQRKDISHINPGSRPPPPVTHIANCIRQEVDWTGSVYIMDETSSSSSDITDVGNLEQSIASSSSKTETSLAGLLKYQLWPRSSSKRPSSPMATFYIDSKDHALAVGRSPTSLSDTAINPNGVGGWPRRGGSLSRRRNISVPELKGKAEITTKITYSGSFADSPTIPGRPPVRRGNSEMHGHERSSSAPGTWRESPFGDAMVSAVAGPQLAGSPRRVRNFHKPTNADQAGAASYNQTRPLSPIFSPVGPTTPLTAVPRSPAQSPARSPDRSPRPVLSPDFQPEDILPENPPPVPPKETSLGSPIRANTMVKRTQSTKSHVRSDSKTIQSNLKDMPPLPTLAIQPPTRAAPSPPLSVFASPASRSDGGNSPNRALPSIPQKRVGSPSSVAERPRPSKSLLRKQKSAPILPKVQVQLPTPDPKTAALLASTLEPETGEASLPIGLKPVDACVVMAQPEKDIIRKQAFRQAENFEILGSKLVTQLSRELRALDERCDYLRKTYKSLRSGRTKLHTRMIAYLKSDSLIFSKERLLKQQEALIELDASIDDWITKLERAENRRLRLRQKLLEHVAASMTLASPTKLQHHQLVTPPRSPKTESPEPLRLPVERKDVESIKIYADNQVLNLFNDIEQAVTKMCEAC